jgi:hypothetical protein
MGLPVSLCSAYGSPRMEIECGDGIEVIFHSEHDLVVIGSKLYTRPGFLSDENFKGLIRVS